MQIRILKKDKINSNNPLHDGCDFGRQKVTNTEKADKSTEQIV